MTKMINKREVLSILGIAPTSPKRLKVFKDLPKYNNPYSKTRVFKDSDVYALVDGFKEVI